MQYDMIRHHPTSNFPLFSGNSCQSSTYNQPERKNNNTFNQNSSQHLEYYSFNNGNQGYYPKYSDRRSYHNQSSDIQEPKYQKLISTYRSRGEKSQELLVKYDSLCQELKTIQNGELIYLFIQEIEENQRSRTIISDQNKKIMWFEDQLKIMQDSITEKRKAIEKFCETESQNLDLIESMELKLKNRGFVLNDHYYEKYTELQKYMNDYICSTNQAQEELLKKIHLIKGDNDRLMEDNQNLARDVFELQKLKDIMGIKINSKDNALLKIHQDFDENLETISSLKEENLMMKKDIEVLIQNLKSYEQFQIDLNKDNREISSSLEFLRERLNANCSLRAQAEMQKNNFVSFKNQEVQELKNKIQQLLSEKESIVQQHDQLKVSYQNVCARLQRVEQENLNLTALTGDNNRNKQKFKNQSDFSKKNDEVETFKIMRRGQSKPELNHDSIDQSSAKAKSGFITNCASGSKTAVSRQTGLSRFDSKENSQSNS